MEIRTVFVAHFVKSFFKVCRRALWDPFVKRDY